MTSNEIILEYLKVVISWPVASIVILVLLKREVSLLFENLPSRLKSAKIGGQILEFYGELENESKVAEAVDNIRKENPELASRTLANVGLAEDDYKEYRAGVRKKVVQVQQLLQNLGYDLGASGVDGVTGSDTKRAVREFQKDHGLPVDGIAGPQTLKMLVKIYNKEAPRGA